jgi:hypothetical protein
MTKLILNIKINTLTKEQVTKTKKKHRWDGAT